MATNDANPIIDVILADINAVVPNFTSLVSSYRLLVGSAEEIKRTSGIPLEIFQRAVLRLDRAGTLIDVLLELLCCKISFASQFLGTICAPVDFPRYLVNDSDAADTPLRTAEQILIFEAVSLILSCLCAPSSCFGPPPPGIGCPAEQPPCPPQPPVETPAKPLPKVPDNDAENLLDEIAPIIVADLANSPGGFTPSSASSSTTPTTPTTPISTASSSSGSRVPPRKHYKKGSIIHK